MKGSKASAFRERTMAVPGGGAEGRSWGRRGVVAAIGYPNFSMHLIDFPVGF